MATNNGNISLAVRNPLDKKLVDTEATVLSQGRLASLASVLTPTVFPDENIEDQFLPAKNSDTSDSDANSIERDQNGQVLQEAEDKPEQTQEKQVSLLSLLKQSLLRQTSQGNNDVQQKNAGSEKTQSQLISDYQNRQVQPEKYPRWGITVIRGTQSTVQELELPHGDSLEGAN